MALAAPIDRQSYPLDKDFKVGDLTFDIVGRFEKTSDSTFKPGKQIITFSLGEGTALQESAFIDITSNPTTIDAVRGVYRYTITKTADRGLDSNNTSSTSLNSQTSERKKHPAGRLVGIVISAIHQEELKSTFNAGTTTNTEEAGENITILDSVSLHTDGKIYKYVFATRPNLVGIANATVSSGAELTYTTFGGLSTGHTGKTIGGNQFAEDTGTIVETATATTTILGTAELSTAIRIAKAGVAVNEYSDSLFRVNDNADGTKQLAFEVSAISTSTTRTITWPDANIDFGDIETLFTLGENLTAADVVRVYNDGGTAKVKKVINTTAQTKVTAVSKNVADIKVAYSTTDDRFLAVYYNSTDTQGEAVVGKVVGDTLTFGTAVAFDTNVINNDEGIDISYDTNANKFLISYSDNTDNLGEAIVATISTGDDSVSFGAVSTFNAVVTDHITCEYDSNAQKHLIVYADEGDGGETRSRVATISGTGVSFGTEADIDTSTNMLWSAISFDSNENKFLVSYYDSGASKQTFTIGTISGTGVTYAGATAINMGNATAIEYNDMAFDSLNNIFLHVGFDRISGGGAIATAIELASGGGSLTIRGQATFDGAPSSTTMGVAYDAQQNKFLIAWESLDSKLDMCDAKIVNGSVKIGAVLQTNASAECAVSSNNLVSNNKFLVMYKNASTSLDGQIVEIESRDQAIGVLKTTGSSGDSKSVNLWGSISDAQSSLTVGVQQWISDAGVATTSVTPYPLGKSVSATDILLSDNDPLGHRVSVGVTMITNAAVTTIQHGLGKVPSKITIYPSGDNLVTAASDEAVTVLIGNPSARGWATMFDDSDTDLHTTDANAIYNVTETSLVYDPSGTILDGDHYWCVEG